jgi:hypothetical protein
MITYDEKTSEIKVRLEGKHVGTIVGSKASGWRYKTRSGHYGDRFATINEVKRSVEGDE